jgi:hypothetical protein
VEYHIASIITDLSDGMVLFKGMMELALTPMCVSFFSKVQKRLHLFQVSTRAHSILLVLRCRELAIDTKKTRPIPS